MEKKININKILKEFSLNSDEVGHVTNVLIRKSILEFGKELLESAAENAKITTETRYYKGSPFNPIHKEVVDKESILNTIKQVE